MPYHHLLLLQPRGDPTNVRFSKVEEELGYPIVAFVPQISLPQFEYPLLACDISKIDQNLIGWDDTVNGMNTHNLIYDIPGLMDTKEPMFSLVKQWKVEAKEQESVDKENDSVAEWKVGAKEQESVDKENDSVAEGKGKDPQPEEEEEAKVPGEHDLDSINFSC